MNVTGIILSGGKSTRMGQDKGFIELNGKPMVQHVIDHINPICDQILISANDKKYEDFGFPVYTDVIKDIGPAGGIISCLNHSTNSKNIIISCDLPFASTKFIRELIDLSGDKEVTLPKSETYLQPLCAVYSKSAYKMINELVRRGIYSLRSILKKLQIQVIEQEDIIEFDLSKELKNINSIEDLKSL